MDEKRSSQRVKKSLKAEVHTEDGMTYSSLVDISNGGVFITTPEPLKQSDKVKLSIHVSDDNTVEITGVTRWNKDEEEDSRAGMGIQFTDLSEDDKAKIEVLLA